MQNALTGECVVLLWYARNFVSWLRGQLHGRRDAQSVDYTALGIVYIRAAQLLYSIRRPQSISASKYRVSLRARTYHSPPAHIQTNSAISVPSQHIRPTHCKVPDNYNLNTSVSPSSHDLKTEEVAYVLSTHPIQSHQSERA
ncbi:hypothetical protein NX059_007912 [Plenodomus lindquistii]|nr:hypothetical protein NX059_007912 [Plenodomus lindquistii]